MDAIKQIERIYAHDAPRFLALEFDDPPAATLVEVKRGDFGSFEGTALPTHAVIQVIAGNGGRADLGTLDLKTVSADALLEAIAAGLPVAHAAGLKGDDAALLGGMIRDAAMARHLTRNIAGL